MIGTLAGHGSEGWTRRTLGRGFTLGCLCGGHEESKLGIESAKDSRDSLDRIEVLHAGWICTSPSLRPAHPFLDPSSNLSIDHPAPTVQSSADSSMQHQRYAHSRVIIGQIVDTLRDTGVVLGLTFRGGFAETRCYLARYLEFRNKSLYKGILSAPLFVESTTRISGNFTVNVTCALTFTPAGHSRSCICILCLICDHIAACSHLFSTPDASINQQFRILSLVFALTFADFRRFSLHH